MKFQPRDLPVHLDTWLTIIREQANHASTPQLKNLLDNEVKTLEQLIYSFKVGDYQLVGRPLKLEASDQELNTMKFFRDMKPCPVSLIIWDNVNGRMKTQFRGIDMAPRGDNLTVVYVNEAGDIKNIPNDEFLKSPEETLREQISRVTKLGLIDVRLFMAQLKDRPLRDLVWECLYQYGKNIAGQRGEPKHAAKYYADYNIDAAMKELGA